MAGQRAGGLPLLSLSPGSGPPLPSPLFFTSGVWTAQLSGSVGALTLFRQLLIFVLKTVS